MKPRISAHAPPGSERRWLSWSGREMEQPGNDNDIAAGFNETMSDVPGQDISVGEEEAILENPDVAEEVIEKWNETTTAEHDEEWFGEDELEHQGDEVPPTADPEADEPLEEIEEELRQEEIEAEIEDVAENEELDKEGYIDGTAGGDSGNLDDEHKIMPEEQVDSESPETNSPTPETPSNVDKNKVWTGEGIDGDDEDDDSVPAPAPTQTGWDAPVPSPRSTIPPIVACSGYVCSLQNVYRDNPSVVLAVLAFVPLFLLCCCRRFCRGSKSRDTRGDYRAVAARYGDMGYDNTFSDTMSDDEDDDFLNGKGDVEDHSWGRSGKRTLEMSTLGYERNGGLSLAEMNG